MLGHGMLLVARVGPNAVGVILTCELVVPNAVPAAQSVVLLR